jgi:hypothetical protein
MTTTAGSAAESTTTPGAATETPLIPLTISDVPSGASTQSAHGEVDGVSADASPLVVMVTTSGARSPKPAVARNRRRVRCASRVPITLTP